jgi:hypothetical protein
MFKYLFIVLVLQTLHRGWHIFFSCSSIFLRFFPGTLHHVHASVVCTTPTVIFSSIANSGPLSCVTKSKSSAYPVPAYPVRESNPCLSNEKYDVKLVAFAGCSCRRKLHVGVEGLGMIQPCLGCNKIAQNWHIFPSCS